MRIARVAREPGPWAVLSGAGLVLALALSPGAPGWLFWGAVAVSCVGAAAAMLLDEGASAS